MAAHCLEWQTGQIRHWPRPGGWHDQVQLELEAMQIAWQVQALYAARRWADVPGSGQFVKWMNSSDGGHYDPTYLELLACETVS